MLNSQKTELQQLLIMEGTMKESDVERNPILNITENFNKDKPQLMDSVFKIIPYLFMHSLIYYCVCALTCIYKNAMMPV